MTERILKQLNNIFVTHLKDLHLQWEPIGLSATDRVSKLESIEHCWYFHEKC